MRRIHRRRRLLGAMLAVAVLPAAAQAMSQRPISAPPARLTVSFGPVDESLSRNAEDDVVVQIAALHGGVLEFRPARYPSQRERSRRLARAAMWLLLASTLAVSLRAIHQRISQARASGPTPTGEV
jgi:hypothetical protein